MSGLARAERVYQGDRLFLVAGESGAIELRRYQGDYWCFYLHSPVWLPEVHNRLVQGVRRRGRGNLPGMAPHRCHILEGDCWAGLIPCGPYDFDRPDADDVIQWEALEELYATHLGAT